MGTDRRIAKFRVGLEEIANLLQLPEGVRPVFMYATSDPAGVWVIVQSDAFPEVPPETEAPPLTLAVYAEVLEVDGKRFVRRFTTADSAQELADRLPDYLRLAGV